ncbi:MAG: hypothetical protein AAGJ74_13785 [Pseudomonadota bacterium]
MIACCFRLCVILQLTFGLLVPKMGAVIAGLVPGVTQVVICTGSEMITLTLGPDGAPIETEELRAEPCVMVTEAAAESPAPALWRALDSDHADAFSAIAAPERPPRPYIVKWPSQGPPHWG